MVLFERTAANTGNHYENVDSLTDYSNENRQIRMRGVLFSVRSNSSLCVKYERQTTVYTYLKNVNSSAICVIYCELLNREIIDRLFLGHLRFILTFV